MEKGKVILAALLGVIAITTTSCKKCSECHYDATVATQVELGEYCDEDLENLEANGYHDHAADTTYEVHCHEH